MGAIIAALSTLGAIAVSIGANHVVELVERKKMEKKKLTSASLTQIVDELVVQAKLKGDRVYDKVLNQISNIPVLSGSDTVTRYVRARKKKLAELRDEVSELQNKASTSYNQASTIASSYAFLSDYEKSRIDDKGSTANTLKEAATTKAEEAKQLYNDLAAVEKQV